MKLATLFAATALAVTVAASPFAEPEPEPVSLEKRGHHWGGKNKKKHNECERYKWWYDDYEHEKREWCHDCEYHYYYCSDEHAAKKVYECHDCVKEHYWDNSCHRCSKHEYNWEHGCCKYEWDYKHGKKYSWAHY